MLLSIAYSSAAFTEVCESQRPFGSFSLPFDVPNNLSNVDLIVGISGRLGSSQLSLFLLAS
jgi:hypothetical protein